MLYYDRVNVSEGFNINLTLSAKDATFINNVYEPQ